MKIAFIGDVHATVKQPRMRIDNCNEALFNKLTYIGKQNYDKVIFLGDLFHQPRANEELENKLITSFRIDFANSKLYTILGNHDFWFDNKTTLYKTALYNIILSQELTLLNENDSLIEDNIEILCLPYFSTEINEWLDNLSFNANNIVIIGHHFYEWPDDMGYSLKYNQINEFCSKYPDKKFKFILGHDHERYDDIIGDNFTIIRPGSLMRLILKQYAISQGVNIIELDTVTFEHKLVTIPSAPAAKIFNLDLFKSNKEMQQINKSINNMKKCVEALNVASDNTDDSIYKVLVQNNADADVIQYLRDIYAINNLAFE